MSSSGSPVYRRPALAAGCLAVILALLTPCHAQPPQLQLQPQQGPAGSYFVDEAYSYNDALDKRVPSAAGFHGMRGKKDLDDLEDKRAPASGFVGMRGKKFGDQDADLEFYEKRAPSAMGFQGMRGKKAGIPDDSDLFGSDKRMGFVGMRGKKHPGTSSEEDVDSREIVGLRNMLLGSDAFKRAPSSGFLGLRGKKAPSQGFLGLRGKKAPSDSSFFGMRGKKSELEDEVTLPELLGVRGVGDAQGLDQLLAYLSEDLQEGKLRQKRFPNNIKKKPSGFLGMRGKKYWIDSKDIAYLESGDSEAKPVQ